MFRRIRFGIPLFLFLLIIGASAVFGAPLVELLDYPSSIKAGDEFNTTFKAINLEGDRLYYAKAVGGDSGYDVQTWSDKTSSWESWNSTWTNLPEFTSNSEGTISATLKARFKIETSEGDKEFKVRVRDSVTNNNYDSVNVSMPVTKADPTPTDVPTSTPTNTPTSTPTNTPTPTDTSTPTPKPTKKLSATNNSNKNETEGLKLNDEGLIMGYREDLSPTPFQVEGAEDSKTNPFPILAGVFVTVGVGLIGVASRPFFQKKKKSTSFNQNEGKDIV